MILFRIDNECAWALSTCTSAILSTYKDHREHLENIDHLLDIATACSKINKDPALCVTVDQAAIDYLKEMIPGIDFLSFPNVLIPLVELAIDWIKYTL